MTPEDLNLPDHGFWQWFFNVCEIPHPSGHEERLRDFLKTEAAKRKLKVRVDAAGNIAIDRPAAAGSEAWPGIILQGHLDMVPQKADGVDFDFTRDPIIPVREGNWITTGGRTTLGADDAVAIAGAMELLCDPSLVCGALRAVFTVGEETGLHGASAIAPEFLDADYLLNLDSGESFTIGCAGGSRLEGCAELPAEVPDGGMQGVKITVSGLHGGHSGEDIQQPYGSANRVLSDLWRKIPKFRIARIDGGTLDNALAAKAEMTGVIPPEMLNDLECEAQSMAEKLAGTLTPAPGKKIVITVEKIARPKKVLTAEASGNLSLLLNELPHGLLEKNADESSATSANLAILCGAAGESWKIVQHIRSLFNDRRTALAAKIGHALTAHGFAFSVHGEYSGWRPDWEGNLLRFACRIFEEQNGKKPKVEVIHGGLETGLFYQVNPALAMISFAPEHINLHSPQERLNIESVERFRKLLKSLVCRSSEIAAF